MAKKQLPAGLLRANGIKALMHAGHSEADAMRLLGGGSHPGHKPRHRSGGGGLVVSDESGTGIKSGRGLHANIPAHNVIAYDQGAIAAIWDGMIDALRTGGAVDISALFPDPCSIGPEPEHRYAPERAMGQEMAAMIGLALKAKDVTPAEWAAWFAKSAAIRIRHSANCGCGCNSQGNNAPGAGSTVSSWGSPFGPPAFSGGTSGGGGAGQ